MWWRKKRRTSAALLLAEPLEPRILYAADLAAGLMLADAADLDDSASQTRVLDAAGDYTAMPPAEVATASGSPPAAAAATQTIPTGTLPLNFEINAGQADASVDFIARGNGVGIALADGNASMLLRDGQSSHVVTMRLAGARDDASAHAEGQVTSRSNYLVGSADTWLRDVANHASVRYDGVYDGIDLRYYGSERSLQYDFIVAAGADWRRIALEFEGVQSLAIDPDGALNLTLAGADGSRSLRFTAPVSYQDGAAGREAVASRYALGEDGRVRFDIGAYDASRTLVIDPVLVYGSYLGGSGFDSARGIAVDGAGNVYLTGETASSAFPTATGAFDTSHNGGTDVYVTKLNAAGTAVIYSTFIGGSGTDSAQDIAIDAAGNAYVTGYTTSTNLPTSGAFQSARAGAQDAFFFKLNAGSTALLYSTYLGGSGGGDYGYAVALDAAGNAYVTGDTDSSSGIASSGAYDTTLGGTTDAFLVKFDPSLTGAASRVFGTYLGGSGGENGFDVAVDAAGKAHVAGYTGSSDLPTTANAYDSSVNGGGDAYVAVFNAAGSALTYSTYFGSTGTDNASAIAIGANGRIYVGGSSAGSGLPTKSAYDTTYGGGPWDAFVASFDPALSGNASLIYSTYLGGAGEDLLTDIAVDTLGRVHLTGSTTGSFSTTADAAQAAHAGGTYDAFYATLGSLGSSLVYSTYLGGSADDIGYAITRDAADRVYIAGGTGSNNLQQITSGAYDTTHNGGGDAFVLAFGNQKLTVTTTNDVVDGNTTSIAALLANKGADGLISLREAIIATNNTAGADAIALGAGTYSLARAGINENAASTGDLDITDTLSIEGAGAAATIINGAALDRVFDVRGTTLTVAGLTVRNGSASDGAGIYVDGSGTLNARDLALSSNHASGNGGALFVSGQLMLDRVTIDANTANNGGALYLNNSATATLTSTTLSGNSATAQGGAVLARGDISIVNSTIAYNSANTGSGIHKQGAAGVTLRNTILAINTGGNASGTLTSLGYNLDSDGSAGLAAAGDLNGSLATPLDPLLGTLQFNGGPTKTHALLPGSPAINAGSATGAPSTDARGAPRLGATDIGAYESTLIAYEPFAYPAGSFNGANGGSGWAAGWSNAGSDTTVDAAGLSAPGISMPVSGGTAKLSIPLIFGSVYQTRELSASLGASAGTYWLSFLVQPASTATEQFIGLGFGNPAGSRAFAGINGNQFVLEQYGGGGRVVVGGIAPVVGQTYLLALRMDMTAGADNLTLFVNPTPAQNAPDSTLTAAKNDLDLGSFTQLGIVGGRTLATNGAALDEIRLAASYLDVAPALVQHAPVLDATKSPALTAQIEDAGVPVGAVGTLVSSLVDLPGGGGLDNVTDADSGAFTGIAVTASDTASGSWWYTIDGGSNWSALGAVSGTNARLLAADANTRLYFQANANFNGTLGSALTFRAWDQTSGSNGTLASTGSNGGVTAFSSATDTASLTINAVNDAPVLAGANNLNAINEDVASGANAGTLVSALIAGQVSDLDAAASSGIAVTAVNNTNGTWQYTTNGGGLWNAFGSPGNNTARLLAADANTSVRFVPNAHWNGTVAGGITFRAWDQSAG
ncbi:MAG: SBBP repeat-containing protein, partial [Burkholderiales bacterium]|nr:SBBP repeat-containing protein [Burkholderiales bacterium]